MTEVLIGTTIAIALVLIAIFVFKKLTAVKNSPAVNKRRPDLPTAKSLSDARNITKPTASTERRRSPSVTRTHDHVYHQDNIIPTMVAHDILTDDVDPEPVFAREPEPETYESVYSREPSVIERVESVSSAGSYSFGGDSGGSSSSSYDSGSSSSSYDSGSSSSSFD